MDEPTTWRDEAACQGTDAELFFPLSEEGSSCAQILAAKQICHACPVQGSCLQWSLEHGATDGIWGGSTASERRAMATGPWIARADRFAPLAAWITMAASSRGERRHREQHPGDQQHSGTEAQIRRKRLPMNIAGEQLPDEVLLAGLGEEDAHLAVAFVRRFQRVIFGVAVAVLGDPAAAEDVAQQAFEQARRRVQMYDPRRGSVRAWLSRITHNLAIEALRTRQSLSVDPDDLPLMLASMTDTPEALAVARDSAAQLRQGLGRLPESQARAVAMAGIYGMTARQIADMEGIPLGTAKTHIQDGLQKLRAAYRPQSVAR
jgi:RNA polymerase sigma factor (sigma-70 family)